MTCSVKEALPLVWHIIEAVEASGVEVDKKKLNKLKNFLRSREDSTLSASAVNGTGCHKRPVNNKDDRGICI